MSFVSSVVFEIFPNNLTETFPPEHFFLDNPVFSQFIALINAPNNKTSIFSPSRCKYLYTRYENIDSRLLQSILFIAHEFIWEVYKTYEDIASESFSVLGDKPPEH